MLQRLRTQKGMCFIEFAVMTALCLGVMIPALVAIVDNVLDILNDLAEDLDAIDDYVADTDLDGFVIESNEDGQD